MKLLFFYYICWELTKFVNKMKKITLILSLFFCFGGVVFAQNKSGDRVVFGKTIKPENISPSGYIKCASNEYEQYLREQNPKMETREQFENWMAQKIEEQKAMSQTGGIIYIPVVVHVIHNGDAYGVNENITDEQVQSQITVMTNDFRRKVGTPGYNTNPVGADTQIEFVLAKVDPNGNPTNGINRVNLCQDSWSTNDINSIVKPATIWDPTLYMNMWSVNFTDSTLLGYAQFPSSSGLAGLNASGGAANTDGVVANYTTFGSRLLVPSGNYAGTQYDEGRTMTHEVGHFLGLRHLWGDGDCTASDYCNDTPSCDADYYSGEGTGGCTSPTQCTEPRQTENYMDYSDDSCMNIYTADQKTRITTVMNNSPRRSTLKTSQKDVAIALFANDAEVIIENVCGAATPTCAVPNPASPAKKIMLYNRGTATMTSADISYNINGGTNYVHNWTGSLAPNKYAVITLANTSVNGTLNTSVTAVNGGADARATNNTAAKTFGSAGLAYANTTTFTFNLVGDRYGSEISWKLKNAAGTPLYSGGPYTDAGSNGTQVLVNNASWVLPASGCYYLTITDIFGDGLYDGVGQGYYTVTGGATTVVNVPDFVDLGNPDDTVITKVSYFTNNVALNNDSFSLIEDVTLYPNPSKDFFTIDVPVGVARNGKVEIYNNIGQQVFVKTVSSDNDLTINASSLSNGVYLINLNLDGATKSLRFIKE